MGWIHSTAGTGRIARRALGGAARCGQRWRLARAIRPTPRGARCLPEFAAARATGAWNPLVEIKSPGLDITERTWPRAAKLLPSHCQRPGVARDISPGATLCDTHTHVSSVAVTPVDAAAAREPHSLAAPSRSTEFLLTGGATLLLLPLCWLLERALGLDSADLVVGFLTFHAAHVINDPHFAVTYLLFYRDVKARLFSPQLPRAQRLRYFIAGFVAPLGLLAWAVAALAMHSAPSLGAFTQLMFLLVGWHYVKQGFGVVTVLSARRGTSYSQGERRALLAHAFTGWAYAWASPFDPGRSVEEKGVIYATFAHPHWLEPATRVAFFASAFVLVLILARKWHREGGLPLPPLVGLLSAVWLWTVYSGIDPLFMYLIPALHSVQYLYFVWLLKRNQAGAHEGPPSFGRPAAVVLGAWAASAIGLGLLLFHLLPSALDAALVDARAARFSDLGPTPYFAALFTFVNLHHYLMDFVIWRRENPETRYLRA
jgi:hypothetical protein